MNKQTLTYRELIDYSGMTRKQLDYYIKQSILPFINVNISGNKNIHYRFAVKSVDIFITEIQQTMQIGEKK